MSDNKHISVEEGNKIIAIIDGKKMVHPNDLKYHSSWDWLMSVVEKIHLKIDVKEVSIRPGRTMIWLNRGSFIQGPCLPENTSIIECWLAVVEFIKWYNTTLTPANNN